MKITIKNQTIDLTDEDLKKHGLQRIEKKEFEVWDKYYFLDSDGDICEAEWDDHKCDITRLETGNAFHTEKEAENHLAWLKARAKIVRRIKELNEGWEPVWGDDENINYVVIYSHDNERLESRLWYLKQYQPQEMYLKSEQLAEQLIKELEPELKIYLWVK